MGTTRTALTDSDIRSLVRGPTEDERASVAYRLCHRIETELSGADRAAAESVLRLMAEDAAALVRRALALALKNSPHLPRDVALRLAQDEDSVAAPVLTFSPVFTDEDLVHIIRASGALKQLAVAKRELLSESVTGALARHACEAAIETAIANDNAAFSEASLTQIVDRFAESEGITTAMAYRRVLPLSICERLVALVADHARLHLVDHHNLPPETALHIALGARERATLDLVEEAGRAADMHAFTVRLKKDEKLTASLLLRALARGHMNFFEWGLAELAGLAHHRAWLMVHDAGPLGLRALYERAGLPPRQFPAFRAGVDAYHLLQAEGAGLDKERFRSLMLERFLTQGRDVGRSDVDYLLDKMDRPPSPADAYAEPAAAHA